MAKPKPVARGSGAPSEKYYEARGLEQLKVRLPRDTIERLGAIAERAGLSRTAALIEMIRRGL